MITPEEIQIQTINHLGLIAGIIDEIGIVDLINSEIGIDAREVVTPGVVVKAIILNGLGFVSKPLYLFPQFFEDKATEHLLGEGIKPNQLNDDKIARVMDKLFRKGLSHIFLLIALGVVKKYKIQTDYSHLDSSSFSLHGEYPLVESIDNLEEFNRKSPVPIHITHGYSRDHRPDLKQFILDLIVSGDGDIPLFLRVADGNENDKAVFGQKLMKQEFVSEQGAREIVKQYEQRLKYHQLSHLKISQLQPSSPKNKAKKPKNDSENIYQITAEFELDNKKIQSLQKRAGRFVLATNRLDQKKLTSEQILSKYKEQQAPERGFGFLKDPLFFADSVFLKSPSRIETMAMLMGLCLLVYSLGQRQLRLSLTEAKTGLKNQLGKLTARPTLRWIFQGFQGIHFLVLQGIKQVVNLTQERRLTLTFFPTACQKYYILSG
jgi:transposase